MSTVHHQGAKKNADKMMADPGGRAVIYDFLWKLQTGFFDQDYRDIFMQKYWGKPDYVDAYAFMLLHADFCYGKIASFKVDIGATPKMDRDEDENNAVLAELSRKHFVRGQCEPSFGAVFDPQKGGSADNDGVFWWKQNNADASYIVNPPDETEIVSLPPKTLPLEVGYTDASKTLIHLRGEGGVARWPYGQQEITVLVSLKRFVPDIPYYGRGVFSQGGGGGE